MPRAHPRAPIELRVEYRRMNAFFADYTRDISKGGVFIRTESPLDAGAELDLRIELPGRAEAILLTGRVAWISETAGDKGMGIQLVWRDEAAQKSFEETVEALMVDKLGETLYRKLLQKG